MRLHPGRHRWWRLLAPVVAALLLLGLATPAQAARVTPEIIDSARGTGNVVSLTFDDGPNPPDTLTLLRVLRKHHVKAVFCVQGNNTTAHPEVVRAIARAGHPLCNHSFQHDDLSALTPEQVRADLVATSAAIRRAVPHARIPYFRAPFGAWGESPAIAADLRMQPLGWRLAITDWEPPGTDELVRRFVEGVTPGAAVLLHDGGGDRSQTVEMVDRIIPMLRAQGWRFTLPETATCR
jgi:peptidoglycan/xylan/chitin deacetylase (PgdA/CDA1 family)